MQPWQPQVDGALSTLSLRLLAFTVCGSQLIYNAGQTTQQCLAIKFAAMPHHFAVRARLQTARHVTGCGAVLPVYSAPTRPPGSRL